MAARPRGHSFHRALGSPGLTRGDDATRGADGAGLISVARETYPPIAAYAAFWKVGSATRAPMRWPVASWAAASGPSGIEFWIR